MSSVGSILKGTPVKINSDLLVGAGLVDSVAGGAGPALTGAVTINAAAQTGISVATVGQDIRVSNSGVTSAIAGTGISVSSGTGAVTISAPTLLPKQTAFTVEKNIVIDAGALPVGYTKTQLGTTFTVPTTGLYIIEGGLAFDVTGAAGVTVGASDWMGVGIETVPLGAGGVGFDLKPWTVPANDDNDYAVLGTQVAILTSGVTYQPYYSSNVSGGITIPSTTAYLEITSLCG